MSIDEILRDRCREGELFPIDPLIPDDPIMRHLFVSADLQAMLARWRYSAALEHITFSLGLVCVWQVD